jgi:hypothetical protein
MLVLGSVDVWMGEGAREDATLVRTGCDDGGFSHFLSRSRFDVLDVELIATLARYS